MADAKRDNNVVTTLIAVSNADGITPVVLWADPTTHRLLVDVSGSGANTALSNLASVAINTALLPGTSDSIALGSATKMWSDLFLGDGAVINFNNGDVTITHGSNVITVDGGNLALGTNSLTMTGSIGATGARVTKGWFTDIESTNMPTVGGTSLTDTFVNVSGDSMTGLLTISLAGVPLRLVNTTDGASVQGIKIEGDRATMADNDEVYASFLLSDDGGTQVEFARITAVATDVNVATSLDGALDFSVMTAGSLAKEMRLTGVALAPSTSDGLALGTASLMWSDIFLASGAVIDFNGDITLTHSADTLTLGGGNLALGANSLIFTDATLIRDAANVLAQRNGSNAQAFNIYNTYTDASNYERLRLAPVGNIFYIITSAAGTGTVRDLALGTADTARWVIAGSTGHMLAGLDNAYDIGASGATRPRNIYTGTSVVVGTTIELGHATDTTISRVSAGVAAIEGVNILTVAGGTLTGNIVLGENTSIDLDPAGSADGKYSGICITGTAGATLSFGQLIYLAVADSRWELTDADALATAGNILIGMCVLAAAADGNATKILLMGQIRADAQFPALTVGAAVYVGETAGAIQVAIPTGADNVIRVVGFALTADEIYFNPSQDHQTTVA